jgi:hypothetical protein
LRAARSSPPIRSGNAAFSLASAASSEFSHFRLFFFSLVQPPCVSVSCVCRVVSSCSPLTFSSLFFGCGTRTPAAVCANISISKRMYLCVASADVSPRIVSSRFNWFFLEEENKRTIERGKPGRNTTQFPRIVSRTGRNVWPISKNVGRIYQSIKKNFSSSHFPSTYNR